MKLPLQKQTRKMTARVDSGKGDLNQYLIPLLDDKALLSCLSYVDLNPMRVGLASTPETFDHTSIKQRAKRFSEGNHFMPFTGPKLQIDCRGIAL